MDWFGYADKREATSASAREDQVYIFGPINLTPYATLDDHVTSLAYQMIIYSK